MDVPPPLHSRAKNPRGGGSFSTEVREYTPGALLRDLQITRTATRALEEMNRAEPEIQKDYDCRLVIDDELKLEKRPVSQSSIISRQSRSSSCSFLAIRSINILKAHAASSSEKPQAFSSSVGT